MRTIETTAAIEPDGKLILQLPAGYSTGPTPGGGSD